MHAYRFLKCNHLLCIFQLFRILRFQFVWVTMITNSNECLPLPYQILSYVIQISAMPKAVFVKIVKPLNLHSAIQLFSFHAGPSDSCDTFTHELRGIIPRSFEYLFSLINREKLKVMPSGNSIVHTVQTPCIILA